MIWGMATFDVRIQTQHSRHRRLIACTRRVLFTDTHSGASLCTPTRYGVLTGRYCWRSSLKRGVLGGLSPPLIDADRLTVAGMLKQEGYATAGFGKWHLGMTWPTSTGKPPGTTLNEAGPTVDFARAIEDGPTTRGFDRFFGISPVARHASVRVHQE